MQNQSGWLIIGRIQRASTFYPRLAYGILGFHDSWFPHFFKQDSPFYQVPHKPFMSPFLTLIKKLNPALIFRCPIPKLIKDYQEEPGILVKCVGPWVLVSRNFFRGTKYGDQNEMYKMRRHYVLWEILRAIWGVFRMEMHLLRRNRWWGDTEQPAQDLKVTAQPPGDPSASLDHCISPRSALHIQPFLHFLNPCSRSGGQNSGREYCPLRPSLEQFLELLDEFRKWSRSEWDKKGKKGHPAQQLPLPVEGGYIIHGGRVPKAE